MKHALALGAILAVFAFFARREVFSWPYYYDEADYMFAASLGWSNYTDQPSQSLADYIRTGLRDGRDHARRPMLSANSRAGSDVNFYRHWHGPLYFYWLAALAPLHLNEQATRGFSYVFPVLTALVIYFGSLWLFPRGGLAAVLSSAFYLWSYATVFSNEIAPHQLFVLFTVTALLLLMKWRATGDQRFWYGSVIAAACAFCTLEVAFVLLAVMIACGPGQTRKSIFLFLATVLFLWPAAVLKLSFAKAYLFMAYLALMRKSAWGDAGFVETWQHRFVESPGEWILFGVAAILCFRFCDSATRKMLMPVVLYGVLMLLVLLRVNTETPRYMLPFLPAFQIAAGFVLAAVLKNWKAAPLRFAATAAILLLLFWNTYTQLRAHPILPAPRLAEVLARVHPLEGQRLLAPQNDLPMIHYYLPGVMVSGYADQRERSVMLAQDNFDAVLYPGYPISLQRQSSASRHYLSQR
ncbi:MAG TPA: hypothetical protein VMH05_26190 [Bryobacteraceae bacterium]|nr:hypothetical protein [Bryobacteraceae bacterium]